MAELSTEDIEGRPEGRNRTNKGRNVQGTTDNGGQWGTNPNKPKLVKDFEMSKISLYAEKQTQLRYLVLQQYDGEKREPFLEENG